MMAEIMSNYNYVCKPETIPKEYENAPAPDPSPSQNLRTDSSSLNKLANSETARSENSTD